MRKIIPLILASLLILVLSGCASSENSIISINLGDAVLSGDPVIDEAARTITATVLPIDISAITPAFEVSGNALIGEIQLTDGAACSCTVTAEDGTTAEWTVTISVVPGLSFKYNGTSKSFLNGVIDSSDSDVNAQYGDGVPYISACTTGQTLNWGYGFREVKDLGSNETNASEFLSLGLSNSFTDPPVNGVQYYKDTGSEVTMFEAYGTVNTITPGMVGEWVTGTFSVSTSYYFINETVVVDSVEITDGFFKLLRLEDNLHSPF